jgi:hypothetical protein
VSITRADDAAELHLGDKVSAASDGVLKRLLQTYVGPMHRSLVGLGLALAIAACHENKQAEGPAERAGKHLDHAAQKTGTALEKAAEKTGAALDKAADATGRALEKTGKKLQGDAAAPAPSATAPAK